jgi:putative phosphoribosyl transferase
MQITATMRFANRRDAGRRLAQQLDRWAGHGDVTVLGLPRGGVPVAFEVARALRAPLDAFVVRKLGVPGHEEFAMGAVASGGASALNEDVIRELQIPTEQLTAVARREMAEVLRRDQAFRAGRRFPDLSGRTVLLVDDGIATGATMTAAVRAVRLLGPARVIVATPVIAETARRALLGEADDVVCVALPDEFLAVGAWYLDFEQTSDDEVVQLLREASRWEWVAEHTSAAAAVAREVRIPAGGVTLVGDLAIPDGAQGVVIFAHGSGSSRRSPRNRRVAEALQRRKFATLLFDLLTAGEETLDRDATLRFDIEFLAQRLVAATLWAVRYEGIAPLPIGYFGASTGAAAALRAAATQPELVRTIVSRGGRPDLAGASLARVTCPTLLIVGSRDHDVIEMNRWALDEMRHAPSVELQLVPGATHLFEEAGTLDEVIRLAGDWFARHLAVPWDAARREE